METDEIVYNKIIIFKNSITSKFSLTPNTLGKIADATQAADLLEVTHIDK